MSCENLNRKNLIYSISAISLIIAYFFIDGIGMFRNTYSYANGDLIELSDTGYIGHMIEHLIARLLLLAIVLFPIIFSALKYHISFKKTGDSDIKKLIPYVRVIFGLIFFYYALTLKTSFSHEVFTYYYSSGSWLNFARIIIAFALFGAFVIDWPVFKNEIKRFPSLHPNLFLTIFTVLIAVCSCLILELQVGSKMGMMSNMLFYNFLYWIIVQAFFDLITRNVKVGAFVSLGLAYLIGLINDVVYQFRGNYIMYGDLTVVRTALEVAGNYKYKLRVWFWISLILLIVSIAIVIRIKFPRHNRPNLKEILIRSGLTIVLVAAVVITFVSGILYNNVNGVGWDYNKNTVHTGYLPYFLSNMNAIKTVNLEDYEPELAEEALDMAVYPEENSTNMVPNIIIIQNEAFADLSVAYDIETNQDYMPFIRSLNDNTRKGYLNMSVTGGPTANTEFEILMRSTLNFLPYGSVPYTQYVDTDLPSVAQVLRNQQVPYYTVAYHPYYSSGYRRTEVYSHFGFDEIVFEDNFNEDFPESEVIRGYLSDSANYRRVEEMYEEFRSRSDAPWFCFNVTIQNHGGYTQEFYPSEEDRVYVTNFEATDALNGYLSLIKISDDAFRDLIEYFSQCDEPTVIAMYGDHQPSMDDDTLGILEAYEFDDSHINNFYVPYVIWANFDIEEEDNLSNGMINTLSTNYFASTVFDVAGIELTDYDRYLLEMHEQMPAITALGVWDNEGNYYSSAASSPFADDVSRMQMIQYNLIFDDDGRLTDRFE